MAVHLRLITGQQAGRTFPLSKSPYIIGRHANADLRVDSPKVSVHHCSLVLRDAKIWVRDLDSTNGTRVNGEPVHGEREVSHGDKLWVGPAIFEVVQTADEGILLNSQGYASTELFIPGLPPRKTEHVPPEHHPKPDK